MRNFYKFTIILLFSFSARAQVVPGATIVTSSNLFCTGLPTLFSGNTSGSPTSFTWGVVPGNGVILEPDLHSPTVTLTFPKGLTYTVYFTVGNDNGSFNTSKLITPAKTATASFNASLNTTGYPAELSLTNYSSSSLKNYWKFSDADQADSSKNTSKYYTGSGSYTVSLIAFGFKGCNDTTDYAFRISDSSSITLPNVFSPNYDNVNDLFKPITKGISQLNVWIFNRDGVVVANWDKVNGAWDGHTTSGEPCSESEYYVVLNALGFDGKTYKLKGALTLIR